MGAPPDIRFGILKCRDLVQLYYGARMVASVIEKETSVATADKVFQVLAADPRRIRLEITLTSIAAAGNSLRLGRAQDTVVTSGLVFVFLPNTTYYLVRDFFTDFDAVTSPLFAYGTALGMAVSTRETFLTPIPIDELP